MHPALSRTDHRPWPLPKGPWTWRQNWLDLLFAHWPIPAKALRPLVPAPLEIQEFDGSAWIGVVPFRMTGVMRRPLPDIPGVSAFPELNVRTYVQMDGKPGVWFLSLDAANWLAVHAARAMFHLPYFHARMQFEPQEDGIRFASRRTDDRAPADFTATYRPTSEPYESRPATLESFLTDRYCLYAQSPGGRLFRGEVHHLPWQLQRAQAEIALAPLLATHGIELGPEPPLLHFSPGVAVIVWPIAPLTA